MIQHKKSIRYADLFWLFMAGSMLGVLIEGVFCIFSYGRWETHTVAVWGPFCIIFGIGAVVLYVGAVILKDKKYIFQFIIFALATTVVEYMCGAHLKYGLHMRAWDYSDRFLNIDGLVCPTFTLAWGAMGLVFSKWCVSALDRLFAKMRGKGWKIACTATSLFMAVNLVFTSFCILRWSQRYQGITPHNTVEQYIDRTWDDDRMQKRFCEWRFIDCN